jgi:hypothetical protein
MCNLQMHSISVCMDCLHIIHVAYITFLFLKEVFLKVLVYYNSVYYNYNLKRTAIISHYTEWQPGIK